MENMQSIINLILGALALAMAVASVILGFMGEADINTHITLLGIGLLALAVNALRNAEQPGGETL